MSLLAPTYPQKNPEESMIFLEDFIEKHRLHTHKHWLIVGSSMGGYVGQHLASRYAVPLILINPALHPLKLFKAYLGAQTNPVTGEQFEVNERFVDMLMSYDWPALTHVPVLLLQDKGDEIVPYQWAYEKYVQTAFVNLYEKGDHTFQHLQQSWEDVLKFVRYAVHLNG